MVQSLDPSSYPEGAGSAGEIRLKQGKEDSIRQNGWETGKMMYFLTPVILEVEGGKSQTPA